MESMMILIALKNLYSAICIGLFVYFAAEIYLIISNYYLEIKLTEQRETLEKLRKQKKIRG